MSLLKSVPESVFPATTDVIDAPIEKANKKKTTGIPSLDEFSAVALLLKPVLEIPTVLFRDYVKFAQYPVTFSNIQMRLKHLMSTKIDDVYRFCDPHEFKITRLVADIRLEDVIVAQGCHSEELWNLSKLTAQTVKKIHKLKNEIHKIKSSEECTEQVLTNGRLILRQLVKYIWDVSDSEVFSEKFAKAHNLSRELEITMTTLEKSQEDLLKERSQSIALMLPAKSNEKCVLADYIRQREFIEKDFANIMRTSVKLGEEITQKMERVAELEKKFTDMCGSLIPPAMMFFSDMRELLSIWNTKATNFQVLLQKDLNEFDTVYNKLTENAICITQLHHARSVDKLTKKLLFLIRSTKHHISTEKDTIE